MSIQAMKKCRGLGGRSMKRLIGGFVFQALYLRPRRTFSTEHLAKGNDNESMGLARSQSWDSPVSTQCARIVKASNDPFCGLNNIDTSIIFSS